MIDIVEFGLEWLVVCIQMMIEDDCEIEFVENFVFYGLDFIVVMIFLFELKQMGIEVSFEELVKELMFQVWWVLILVCCQGCVVKVWVLVVQCCVVVYIQVGYGDMVCLIGQQEYDGFCDIIGGCQFFQGDVGVIGFKIVVQYCVFVCVVIGCLYVGLYWCQG